MTLLKRLQRLLVMLDRVLQLFDVLGPPLPECGLSLTIALLALLRRRIDLETVSLAGAERSNNSIRRQRERQWGSTGSGLTGFRPPFLFWTGAASGAAGPRSPSGSGDEMDELVKPSSRGSSLGTTKSRPVPSAAVMSAAAIDPISGPLDPGPDSPPCWRAPKAGLAEIDARLGGCSSTKTG
jgi:hypothetical protein